MDGTIARRKLLQFGRYKICRGDARHLVTIKRRELGLATVESLESGEVFTNIAQIFAAIKTDLWVRRFNNVNVDSSATHFFAVLSTPITKELEIDNYFIEFNNKLYKILGIDNIDEINKDILIQCVERGSDLLAANEA